MEAVWNNIYKAIFYQDRWMWYLEGLGKTLLISLGAVLLGCFIGIVVALIKYVAKKFGNLKALDKVCDVYLTIFRGTPVYVQLLIMYTIVLVAAPTVWVAIITFGINRGP